MTEMLTQDCVLRAGVWEAVVCSPAQLLLHQGILQTSLIQKSLACPPRSPRVPCSCMHACMQLNCERTPCPQSIAKEHETETSLHPGVHACKARMVRALTWAFDLYAHSRRAKAVRWSKALLRDTGAQIRILVPRRHTGATQGGPGHVPLCLLLVCASLPTYRSHRGGVLRCAEKGARLVSTSDSP